MKNIILFGGAFDPVHNGHLNMAEVAANFLDAEVVFIPARISVWKTESVSAIDKLNMLEIAIKNHPNFSISRIEIDSNQDINYSIDTIKNFKDSHTDDNLFLLIGTDQVNSFDKWKCPDEIAEIVQIVYFDRPGLELNRSNIERFKMKNIPGEMREVSSSDIRECKCLDIPLGVLDYIIEHNLYFINKIKCYLKPSRFIHSASVAKLAYEIAVENGVVHQDKYLIAGLLHDVGKYLSKEDTLKIMNEHFAEYLYLEPMIYHQFTGKYIVETVFGINDKEILDAIEFHTTGNGNMSDLSKVLYCSDKIEPTRGFDSTKLINNMKVNINSGMRSVLISNIEYYEKHKVNYLNPLTKACIKAYLD